MQEAPARPSAVKWPKQRPDAAWVNALAGALFEASQAEPKRLPRWLPSTVLTQLVGTAQRLFAEEETLVEASPCRA